MKFLDQKGISLVESLVAIGITAAAGVAYMTHTQTVAKNEARQKVRSSIELLHAQTLDYLKSRDVCNQNLEKAFSTIPITTGAIAGNPDYSALKNKGFKDASGNLVQTDIFKAGDTYEGGKILVTNVAYNLSDIIDVNAPSSPWTKSGKVKVSVEMETCRDGGVVVLKDPNGVLQERCARDSRQKVIKSYDKHVAFKTTPAGIITTSNVREKILDPLTGKFEWKVVGTKRDLACADSQDALVDAAAKYTDIKVCIAELKMMMLAGKEGMSECGIELSASVGFQEYTSSTDVQLPTGFVPNSLLIELLGGGGGGGSGGGSGDAESGRGGKAGSYVKQLLSNTNSSCSLIIGSGGSPGIGGRGKDGGNGGETKLSCGEGITIVAGGGAGGKARGNGQKNCGTAGDNSIKGQGSAGNCRRSGNKQAGGIGAGGGGGGENGRYEHGKAGGSGWAKLTWKKYVINDPDHLLEQQGLTAESILNSYQNN